MSSSAPTGDSPPSRTPEQRVYDEHRVSVVQMTCVLVTKEGRKLGVGTGFVVHNDGASCLVLTCAHVIDPKRRGTQPKELSVRFGADHIASARLVHVSEHVDLALIRVQGAPNCIPLGFSDEADLSGKEGGIDKQGAAADAGELLSGQVKAVRKPWRSRCRRRRGTSFGLDEKEELVACHRDARLGGELDGGHRDDGGDGEGEGVDDGGAAVADVVLEDKELATGVVDAARVAVGHGGDRGPGGGGRVGGVEEESLAAGRHDAMRRPVPGQVVRLGEEGRERREGADGAGEEVEERRGEVGGVDGERPPVRGDVEDAVAARSGGGVDGGGGEGGRR
uniref:Uncharacterized protein n=1 Tax=Oryza nivara TaxID=4536 RepID=A0A0E0GC52_ORYNI